jgi:hypothetical protein
MHHTNRNTPFILHTHLSRICGYYFRVCLLVYQVRQKPILSPHIAAAAVLLLPELQG